MFTLETQFSEHLCLSFFFLHVETQSCILLFVFLQRLSHQLSFTLPIVIRWHIVAQKDQSASLTCDNQLYVIVTQNCEWLSVSVSSAMWEIYTSS